jgi:hypothetical protein
MLLTRTELSIERGPDGERSRSLREIESLRAAHGSEVQRHLPIYSEILLRVCCCCRVTAAGRRILRLRQNASALPHT